MRMATTSTGDTTAGRVESLLSTLSHEIPKECGEAAFEAPWELRALAMAVAAHDEGRFGWTDFQQALIRSIQDWEAAPGERAWQYYERWLVALESLLERQELLSAEELDERTRVVLNTPRDASHQHAHPEPVAVDSRNP